MGFQDVAFPPAKQVSTPRFLKIVSKVKSLGSPQVTHLWMGTSKTTLSAKYLTSNKSSLKWQSHFLRLVGMPQSWAV